ncbi:hypothetical protein TTRE_0000645901 [Trichuris trichiura]|uniref:Uncharacterized protein n=1 Tax=Trichuris trichiura TaxID=36087 RepID=A0A077ZEB4_TRITR|nr:hypothetical protein TTRE_0000645901 [Trichuris trichiura]
MIPEFRLQSHVSSRRGLKSPVLENEDLRAAVQAQLNITIQTSVADVGPSHTNIHLNPIGKVRMTKSVSEVPFVATTPKILIVKSMQLDTDILYHLTYSFGLFPNHYRLHGNFDSFVRDHVQDNPEGQRPRVCINLVS